VSDFDVVPIGTRAPQPKQFASISVAEREARARVHKAHRVGVDHAVSSGPDGIGKQLKKVRLRSVVSVSEALGMTSHLARLFYRDASVDGAKGSERKHLAVGYGVMIDKLNALSGRPTQVIGFAETDQVRGGVLELAQRLAESTSERSA